MTDYSNYKTERNRFRIIAGKWRSRVLRFPGDVAALRPTTDRIRETLFNWLQQKTAGARCLDLFSGSGALAFEACSRGAASVTAVDISPEAVAMLKENCRLLHCSNLFVTNMNAFDWLQNQSAEAPFDIVFLDPPYDLDILPECCHLLEQRGWLAPGAVIYLESSSPLDTLSLPSSWRLLRHKKGGQVYYGVCERAMD